MNTNGMLKMQKEKEDIRKNHWLGTPKWNKTPTPPVKKVEIPRIDLSFILRWLGKFRDLIYRALKLDKNMEDFYEPE